MGQASSSTHSCSILNLLGNGIVRAMALWPNFSCHPILHSFSPMNASCVKLTVYRWQEPPGSNMAYPKRCMEEHSAPTFALGQLVGARRGAPGRAAWSSSGGNVQQFYMAVLGHEQANSATYSWRDCVMPASTSCPAALASPSQRESPRKETPRPGPLAGAVSSLQTGAALQRQGSSTAGGQDPLHIGIGACRRAASAHCNATVLLPALLPWPAAALPPS